MAVTEADIKTSSSVPVYLNYDYQQFTPRQLIDIAEILRFIVAMLTLRSRTQRDKLAVV